MRFRTFVLLAAMVLVPSSVYGYGEVIDDYPAYEEMYQLVWTNRVRQDTAKAKKDYHNPAAPKNKTWSGKSYAPCQPVMYHHAVSKAARAHSKDMAEKGYFAHEGQDGSTPSSRVKRYFTGARGVGENIAKGQSGPVAVTTAWLNSDGHRENIFRCSWTHLGMGWVPLGRNHWTQNFIVMGGNYERPMLHAGIHTPKSPQSNEKTEFYTNFLDKNGAAPKETKIVINGVCYDMKLDYGSESNGTYKTAVNLKSGCAAYYFKFRGSDGELSLFPSRGSYQASVDGGSCNGFYAPKQAASNCDAGCKDTSECASHQECIDKKCVDTGRCQGTSDCTEGYTCKKNKCQPEGQIGGPCQEDGDCAKPMSCVAAGAGSICTTACSSAKACPPGYTCRIQAADQGYCRPSETCKTDSDCSSFYSCQEGKCVARGKCKTHAECEKGTMCVDGTCKGTGTQGEKCSGSTDCDKGSECIPWESGGDSFCGITCLEQADCPVDSTCKTFSGDSKYCFGKPEPPVKVPVNDGGTDKPGDGGCSCNITTSASTPGNSLFFALAFLCFFVLRRIRND